jgi:hypothetical protein
MIKDLKRSFMKNVDKLKYHYQKLILEELPETLRPNVFIAGGAIRDYLSNAEVKDIDMFTTNKQSEDELIKFFKEKGKLINENDQIANYTYKERWFQVIKGRHFTMPQELIESFDFTICQAVVFTNVSVTEEGLKVGGVEFDASTTFFQDTLSRHLRINKITFPLSTLERMQKYIQRGYVACNGTLLEIAKSLNGIDLNNPSENTLQFYPNGSVRFFGVD